MNSGQLRDAKQRKHFEIWASAVHQGFVIITFSKLTLNETAFEQETSDILVFHEQNDILNCIMSCNLLRNMSCFEIWKINLSVI